MDGMKGGAGAGNRNRTARRHAATTTAGASSAEAAGRLALKSHRLGFIPVSFLPSRTAMAPGIYDSRRLRGTSAPQIQLYVLLSSRL
jgi:hypothetical protein